MPRDRIHELQAVVTATGFSPVTVFTRAHEDLARMQDLVEKMALVHTDIYSSVDQNSDRLDPIVQEFQQTASKVRALLQDLRGTVSPNDISARGRMQWSQYQAVSQRFGAVAKDFNAEQMAYREKCKQRIRRQLEIMGNSPTDEHVEDMLTKNDVFVEGASQLQIDEARLVLDEVRERQRDIQKLEESVQEVTQLFTEVAMLVETQGEVVGRIADNVQAATIYVEEGGEQLLKAREHQSSARRKKFWLLFFVIIVIVLIVVVIYFSSK